MLDNLEMNSARYGKYKFRKKVWMGLTDQRQKAKDITDYRQNEKKITDYW